MIKKNSESIRQLRVSQLINIELDKIFKDELFFDIKIPANSISITKISVSPDLKNVSVFFISSLGLDKNLLLTILNDFRTKIRYFITNQIKLKFSPQFTFRYDYDFEKASKVEEILLNLDKKQS